VSDGMIEPVRETGAMLAAMQPVLDRRDYLFCTTADSALAARAAPKALALFREAEGVSLILEAAVARAFGFGDEMPMRRITLGVVSALDGVGLTAAVAAALAGEGISCNVVAAFHHDHVFVPAGKAEDALRVLTGLQAAAKGIA